MSIQNSVKKTASIGILAIGSALVAQQATAAVPDQPKVWEKCGGIAAVGKNDCGSMDGKHKCAGQSSIANSDVEWVYVPQGTCEKITGGMVLATKKAK